MVDDTSKAPGSTPDDPKMFSSWHRREREGVETTVEVLQIDGRSVRVTLLTKDRGGQPSP